MNDPRIQRRSTCILGVLIVAVVGLGFRLASLHLGGDEEVRGKIRKKREIETTLEAPRGKIFDRNGRANILAMNLVMKDVCVNPSVSSTSATLRVAVEDLSGELGLPSEELQARMRRPNSQFVYLRRFIPADQADNIVAKKYPGVFLRDNSVRYYPQASFLCHVLGFVNHEGVGSAGVEQQLDHILRGLPGYMECAVDARRQELPWKRTQYLPPTEGAGVTLTIDQNIQFMVEQALDAAVEKNHARGAWAIVQNIRTGEILAMANRPAYDLNKFYSTAENLRLNRAIGHVYEPGSVFKAITFSAALNEKIVKPRTLFDCENGLWHYKGKPLKDYHPYGYLSVADGVKKSSNIMTAKIALMLGDKKLYSYLREFGVGQKTGVDLPGEEMGILPQVSKWSGISITRIPIGQGVAVTALQMLAIYGAIANHGFMMKPYIIKQVERSDGTLIYAAKQEVLARPITEETAAVMSELLGRVTEDGGTGRKAAMEGYGVAGKTGTAQKPVDGGYSSTAYMASFVGFLPVENPELGIVVVVDEPQPLHTGGVVAAPVFKSIASQAIRYLDIPPTKTDVGVQVANRPEILADEGDGSM